MKFLDFSLFQYHSSWTHRQHRVVKKPQRQKTQAVSTPLWHKVNKRQYNTQYAEEFHSSGCV